MYPDVEFKSKGRNGNLPAETPSTEDAIEPSLLNGEKASNPSDVQAENLDENAAPLERDQPSGSPECLDMDAKLRSIDVEREALPANISETQQVNASTRECDSQLEDTDPAQKCLSPEISRCLQYHKTRVNSHHYLFKHDADDFLHVALVEEALSYDPLLYGVVGFAAFQQTVLEGHGQIHNFFGYYNRSVTLLRQSLARGEVKRDATLLTALVLATFEGAFETSHTVQQLIHLSGQNISGTSSAY